MLKSPNTCNQQPNCSPFLQSETPPQSFKTSQEKDRSPHLAQAVLFFHRVAAPVLFRGVVVFQNAVVQRQHREISGGGSISTKQQQERGIYNIWTLFGNSLLFEIALVVKSRTLAHFTPGKIKNLVKIVHESSATQQTLQQVSACHPLMLGKHTKLLHAHTHIVRVRTYSSNSFTKLVMCALSVPTISIGMMAFSANSAEA